MMSSFTHVVIEGFGDYTNGLAACDGVRVIRNFNSEEDAQAFAVDYYESDGEDADGFTVSADVIQSWFVLVRPVGELGVDESIRPEFAAGYCDTCSSWAVCTGTTDAGECERCRIKANECECDRSCVTCGGELTDDQG